MMLFMYLAHLSNIWSSIREKVKQHWVWIEKKRRQFPQYIRDQIDLHSSCRMKLLCQLSKDLNGI